MSTSSPARRRSGGFSLLEVIVALAIMGIAVVSLMQLFSSSLRTIQRTEDYTRGLLFARSLMDEAYARAKPEDIPGVFDLDDGFKGARTTDLAASSDTTEVYDITVTVQWGKGGELTLAGKRTFRIEENELQKQ